MTDSPRSFDAAGDPANPAIVLVHGSVVSRQMWGPQIRGLSDQFRVIAPDLPGHGTLARVPFSFDASIDHLRAIIQQEAGGRAIVVGLSLGGYIAIELAAMHPKAVRALVLAGTTVNFTGALGWYLRAVAALMRRGWLKQSRATAERKVQRLFPASLAADAEAQLSAGVFPDALGPAFYEMAFVDFSATLSTFDGPTLIVNGERDTRARQGAVQFAAAARDAKIETIADAGHACNLDQPEAFNRIVRVFAATISSI